MTTATQKKVDDFSEQFIARLESLVKKEDRGALATLRRGLSKDVPFEVYRFMPFTRNRWQEDTALIIGPLFAYWHQGEDKPKSSGEKQNLGASIRTLVRERENWEDAMKSIERRFGAMLNCHADDLRHHLRHAVSLLRSKDVSVNWRLLCDHVQQWDHPDRWVQREWARSFWAPKSDKPPEGDTTDQASQKNDSDKNVE